MTTDSSVQLPPNSSGPLVDTEAVSTAAGTVQRQRVSIGDPTTGSALAGVGAQPSAASLAVNIAYDQLVPVVIRLGEMLLAAGRQASESSLSVTLAHDERFIPVTITDGLDTVGNSARPVRIDPVGTTPQPTTISGPAATDNFAATVFAPGASLRTAQEPTQLFWDAFDIGLDLQKWGTPVAGGTGIAATSVAGAGSTTLDSGTTLNSYSLLQSIATFRPLEPGYIYTTFRNNIEFPVVTTAYRFWGLGTTPSPPTIAAPVTDAAGWEVTTAGKLAAVTYAGGGRNLIQDLSATGSGKQPSDSSAHKYFMWFRGDQIYWAIDSVDNVVATVSTGALGPNVNTFPITALAISNAGTHAQLIINGVAIGDTARNNTGISDGTYPWRKAVVSSAGALSANIAAIGGLTPSMSNPLPVQLSDGTSSSDLRSLVNVLTAILYETRVSQQVYAAHAGLFIPQAETLPFLGA